ncbi:DUF2997 domain-containing protein [Phormidium sp. CCY1219]|uniref:DUF2997 domain-containing protein n=1 Tax=Phormidium sp. CCY1219 TaxID=2886104 RepID=UPI002D1ED62F|nr:DUF2997 domain-containing protein [Phormidium sp. CCY1219]MEB3827729.1 DUF2997 domain-containing protein [Phormidium sp. CCY1219]
MAEYRQVEYRIGKDGKVIETVLNATGDSCIETTAAMEEAIGEVESRELLPEYYQESENMVTETTEWVTEG